MADKLGLGPEVRELKIGSSFFSNRTEFHTLRYDFKPASVVSGSKAATLEIGSNHQVTVTHVEASGASQTVFKGSRKPYQKECVLIIDKNTGQITLEKLNTNIQLKKTRPEGSRPHNYGMGNSSGSSGSAGAGGRPPTPVEKKQSPPGVGRTGGRAAVGTKQSPRQVSSPQYNHRNSPVIIHKSPPQLSNLSLSPSPAASLPMIDDCNDNSSSSFDISTPLSFPELRHSPDFNSFHEDDGLAAGGGSNVGVLSDSTSDSDSDSKSSGSNSDPPRPNTNSNHPRINGHVNGKNSSSNANHFLTEDLQLSESGSDSD